RAHRYFSEDEYLHLGVTAADKLLRSHLYGDVPESVVRARRALADIHWLIDHGVIDNEWQLRFVKMAATCETCNREFTARRVDARYCSSACRQRAYRQRKTES